MAFDAFMVAAVTEEINKKLSDARVEKVLQPEKDEIVLVCHAGRESYRLSISASPSTPRINISSLNKENPISAPMFCMLLRKHLQGGKLVCARQLEFERVVELEFDTTDELGFEAKRFLICEIMGKYSNIIFCNEEKKIISAIKIVDFTTSQKRQILPTMLYEMPPKQDKLNPLEADREQFLSLRGQCPEMPADKFLTSNYAGIAAFTARELAYRSGNDANALYEQLENCAALVKNGGFVPYIITKSDGTLIDYSFLDVKMYGNEALCRQYPSFSALIEDFYYTKEKAERIRQRGNDILKLLTNIEGRITKKLSAQKCDLAKCEDMEKYRLYGDLITANIYRMKKGADCVSLENYYSENCECVDIPLDTRLTPAQNAQKYYKKYAKCKSAKAELTHQISLSNQELDYIYTVFDSAAKAETEADLSEIRQELYQGGYASRMKDYASVMANAKKRQIKIMKLKTTNGYTVLCGKNNIQNDYITTKLAEKTDYWFHVKNAPGSHVVLQCNGEEPPAEDFTDAAEIAAYYSSQKDNENVAVDYTFAKSVKKPGGSKAGFVTYSTNWTAYVTPNEKKIEKMKVSK